MAAWNSWLVLVGSSKSLVSLGRRDEWIGTVYISTCITSLAFCLTRTRPKNVGHWRFSALLLLLLVRRYVRTPFSVYVVSSGGDTPSPPLV